MLTLLLLVCQPTPTEALLEQLRSDKPAVREEAARALRSKGEVVIPSLEQAAKDPDADLASRARELLKAINADGAELKVSEFRQVVASAKTVRLEFAGAIRLVSAEEPTTKEVRGSWWIGTGTRARASLEIKEGKGKTTNRVVFWSDGVEMLDARDLHARARVKTPDTFKDEVIASLVNLGPTYASLLILKDESIPEKQHLDCSKFSQASGFRLAKSQSTTWTEVAFKLRAESDFPRIEMNLEFGASGRAPLKRTVSLLDPGTARPRIQITEAYAVFSVDETIPDSTFVLPKEDGR